MFFENSLTRDVVENLHRFVHGLVRLIDVLLQLLSIDRGERVVHPGLMPADPVRAGHPEIPEWLKVLHKLSQLVILEQQTHHAALPAFPRHTCTGNTPLYRYFNWQSMIVSVKYIYLGN